MLGLIALAACGPAEDVAPDGSGRSLVVLTYTVDGDGEHLRPDTAVALDRGDGTRIEGTTDEDGRILLEDLGDGPFGLVASDGDVVASWSGVSWDWLADAATDRGYFPVAFPGTAAAPVELATVQGTVSGFSADAELLVGVHPFGVIESRPSFSFEAPKGRTLEVVAVGAHEVPEEERISPYDFELAIEGVSVGRGVAGDGAIDVVPVETTTFSVWSEFRDSAFFRSCWPTVYPTSLDTGGEVAYGYGSWIRLEGGEIGWDGVYHALDTAREPFTRYRLAPEGGKSWSTVDVAGWPEEGAMELHWAEPPVLGSRTWSVADELDVELSAEDLADPDLGLQVAVFDGTGALRWSAWFPPGTSQIVLPELPAGVEAADVVEDGSTFRALWTGKLPDREGWRYGVSTAGTATP